MSNETEQGNSGKSKTGFNIAGDTRKHTFTHTSAGGKAVTALPWAACLHLAGRPAVKLLDFASTSGTRQPFREIFGGAAVAAESDGQVVYLPIQDRAKEPVKVSNLTARDVNDSQSRVRAKVVAMATGVGLSLFAGKEGNGPAFAAEMGNITESTEDLGAVQPWASTKRDKNGNVIATYMSWPAAIAAAKLSDGNFRWCVGEHEVINKTSGEVESQPYMAYGNGYAVSVTLSWRDRQHTEILPIMGMVQVQTKNGPRKMDNQPLLDPTVNDWNKAVMRCLAKAIAVCTGYGLAVYAKMEFDEAYLADQQTAAPSAATAAVTPIDSGKIAVSPATANTTPSGSIATRDAAIATIEELVVVTKSQMERLLGFMGVNALEEASDEMLVKVTHILRSKQEEERKKAA